MLELQTNYNIESTDVLVIDEDGRQLGVMKRDDAIDKAKERDLDLVQVSNKGQVPTCKFMDYGKYKFDQTKKEKQIKHNQKTQETSEIQISLTIQEHDMQTKRNMVKRLIEKGNIVRVVLRLRGRERNMTDAGVEKINEFVKMCDFTTVKKEPFIEGNDVKVLLEK